MSRCGTVSEDLICGDTEFMTACLAFNGRGISGVGRGGCGGGPRRREWRGLCIGGPWPSQRGRPTALSWRRGLSEGPFGRRRRRSKGRTRRAPKARCGMTGATILILCGSRWDSCRKDRDKWRHTKIRVGQVIYSTNILRIFVI